MFQATDLKKYQNLVESTNPIKVNGKVTQVVGLTIEGHGPGTTIGGTCDIFTNGGRTSLTAEVVGFRDNKVLLMPLGEMHGIGPGSRIVTKSQRAGLRVGDSMLGRVIDSLGNPIDQKGPLNTHEERSIYSAPINPLHRRRISEPVDLGIKAINGILTCAKGQRLGILAGTGVGKSVLLGMIARNTTADVNVIALIGERGREVREFLEKDLGDEGLKRSVVIVATSDQPPLIRVRGCYAAVTVAEYFRNQGKHVVLMMDSITRFAMAQREIGLAIGEPPTTKAYTPSVFSMLPKLLERAGTHLNEGSITGLYTVLVEGDDTSEPIADAVRSILDGHIILSRDLAAQNHYPAIDMLHSISRSMIDVVTPEHREYANKLISILATYKKAEDLIDIGAYVKGSNSEIDYAIKMIDKINSYLRQDIEEKVGFEESIVQLKELFQQT
ncbi:MAG: flagellar protein export ATPase FliI [Thermodesulfobacteriota bacterium]|nr:flagellar protein export ATPase FliI [Thermodesulfobacteriota bacterium]